MNKRFFTFHNKKRPYIILKWAETRDGFIDKIRENRSEKNPNWISNKISQQLVHKWRSEEQSILVGTNTVINDNPRLNVRRWVGKNPVRLILDNSLRIPHDFHVFDGSVKTIVFTSSRAMFAKVKENVILEYIDYSKSIPKQICDKLYECDIQSVIIEGGAQILQSFIYDKLWDEARIFIGNTNFGEGLKAPKIEGEITSIEHVDTDTLKLLSPIH
jgi:diaminohydroxyphosphoribosylaminopyrimidine deaminase/5-amino-6-(5-phosphoribosylamino)uracil reductase